MVQSSCELYDLAITPSLTAPAAADTLYVWLIFPLQKQELFCWVCFLLQAQTPKLAVVSVYLKVSMKEQRECTAVQDICSHCLYPSVSFGFYNPERGSS